jgi:hypothetical protein
MDPNHFCAHSTLTAEDLTEFPELYQVAGESFLGLMAQFEGPQVAIPENEAVEVVQQAVPVQEVAQPHIEELGVFEPSWRSNDGSWPEDFSFAVNNVSDFNNVLQYYRMGPREPGPSNPLNLRATISTSTSRG